MRLFLPTHTFLLSAAPDSPDRLPRGADLHPQHSVRGARLALSFHSRRVCAGPGGDGHDHAAHTHRHVFRGQAERPPGLLHLLPRHLDADLNDLCVQLHPRVHTRDLLQQNWSQEKWGEGEKHNVTSDRHH